MNAKKMVKKTVKQMVYGIPVVKDYAYGVTLYRKYRRDGHSGDRIHFLREHASKFYLERARADKAAQIARLLRKVDICPVENDTFFYSLDCLKTADARQPIFGNCTAGYDTVVHSSFRKVAEVLAETEDAYGREELVVLSAWKDAGKPRLWHQNLAVNWRL